VAPRANWKGFLKIAQLACPVALYTAASTSDRIAFHIINRTTGHRVHRQFVDSETGDPVEKENQVKGFEVAKGDYVRLELEEIASAIPESNKTINVSAFVSCDDVDDVYFDKPYYLAPAERRDGEVFGLIREGLIRNKAAAIARAVLFRRERTLLIRAYDGGLIATTLHFDYEIRSAKEAFAEIPDVKIEGEMMELAKHIIETKMGVFDPSKFEDRYEAALTELVKAKMEGRKIEVPKVPRPEKVVNLLEALRASAGMRKQAAAKGAAAKAPVKTARRRTKKTTTRPARRKAG
jgi:DNA end-binding protein Ku